MSSARVLVVDDHADTVATMQYAFEHLGHPVRVAYSGPEAVRVALAWLPQVIFCDLGLPGLDGLDVVRALRRHPPLARTLMIAVSGFGSVDDKARALEAGFDHHLTKPADLHALLEFIAAPAVVD